MQLRRYLCKKCLSNNNTVLLGKYFGLTPVIAVLVSGMGEYNGRRGIKLSDGQYHVDEDVDVEANFRRGTKKNENQHQTER